MLIAKYKGELYNVDKKGEEIEIFIKGKKDGFQYIKDKKGIVSYKLVHKNELEALYTVKYYTVWNGERFEFDYICEDAVLRLWRFDLTNSLIEKYGFTEIERGEKIKLVPLEACECFILEKKDYDNQDNKSEIILSQDEFLELYEKFI